MALATTLLFPTSPPGLIDVDISRHVLCAGVCDEKGTCVCVRGRRWRCSRISACFWRLCDQVYGAAGCWARKRGFEEL
eukprot:COSAG02_NODE_7448_length_3009_cov_2.048454_2_plen_78_part_00